MTAKKHSLTAQYLQGAYFASATAFSDLVPLDVIERNLKKLNPALDLISVLFDVLNTDDYKFRIDFLMMPNWASRNKSHSMYGNSYTHLRIKTDLLA